MTNCRAALMPTFDAPRRSMLLVHYVVFCSTQDHLPEENARLTCRTVGPAAWVYLRR